LSERSERIEQLEQLIANKEAAMKQLKDAVSNALANFEGNGLTVERKNGKVYVSMENKLLFSSGSWSVGAQGRKAVAQLAKVLNKNKDIEVLIEGHTDNVPYQSNGAIKDNWDLSTKRATAIVRILTNNGVQPNRVTAAGRGAFFPVASNATKEGRAKNRRIEIILAPNLDKINALLE
jgi:chemotaxis protein MotB